MGGVRAVDALACVTSSRSRSPIGVNVFYILLVDRLGFIPTGIVYLAVLFCGVRRASEMDRSRSPSC